MQRKVAILGTGGTIAGLGEEQGGSVGYQAAQIGVAQLMQGLSVAAGLEPGQVITEQVAQIDSKDMDAATWTALVEACWHWLSLDDIAAIVITHGTDTLEETAWLLQCLLSGLGKPVVLTCAMRPANALSADGPANLRDALVCALDPGTQALAAAGSVAWLCAAGEVHAAQHLSKVHPYRLNAFSSPGRGAMAWVEEGRVRWAGLPPPASQLDQLLQLDLVPQFPASWPWVEVVASQAAADGRAVDALVAAGVRGLVVAGTGNGAVHHRLNQALARAQAQSVVIWLTSRCAEGVVVPPAEGSYLPVVALSPHKARISLLLALMGLPHGAHLLHPARHLSASETPTAA